MQSNTDIIVGRGINANRNMKYNLKYDTLSKESNGSKGLGLAMQI